VNDLIINSTSGDVNLALLEDKQLVELHTEKKDNNFTVGDIYLGRIKKVIPGLNAAFVDIGYEKDAFLHYLDLGSHIKSFLKFTRSSTNGEAIDPLFANFKPEALIEKSGKISNVLASNQWIMVQIAKEPISTKGPRITSEISLAGRYLVLVPFSDDVSVSQKLKSSEERNRLKRLVQSIKPKNFGVIIRTVAEGKKVADLDKDMQDLISKWNGCIEQLKTAKPPQKLLGEMDRTSTVLRDLLNANFNNIHVNDQLLFEEIKLYIQSIAPEQIEIVKHYKGKVPIFEHFGIEKQIKGLFGKTVNMPSSSYLIIEHTEALHVIDVNSGARIKSEGNTQESNALQVNLDAAKEVARQLRLRDMGGIIVVDFIDLHLPNNRKLLFDTLKNEMKKDRAKHNILPPSKFGLVQITRQRVRPETNIVTVEKCPACDGTGEIKASILLTDDIENNIRFFIEEQNEKSLRISVHPYVAAYLKKGFISIALKWQWKFKQRIQIRAVNSYHLLECRFFNDLDEEIKI